MKINLIDFRVCFAFPVEYYFETLKLRRSRQPRLSVVFERPVWRTISGMARIVTVTKKADQVTRPFYFPHARKPSLGSIGDDIGFAFGRAASAKIEEIIVVTSSGTHTYSH